MMHTTASFPSAYTKELAFHFLYTDGTSRFFFRDLSASDPEATETFFPLMNIFWQVLSKGGIQAGSNTGECHICLQHLLYRLQHRCPGLFTWEYFQAAALQA